jgi:hypothetical protein
VATEGVLEMSLVIEIGGIAALDTPNVGVVVNPESKEIEESEWAASMKSAVSLWICSVAPAAGCRLQASVAKRCGRPR